jgi:serine/threonine protein phosphatase PrpC
MAVLTLRCATWTDVGRRENNEDSLFASPWLAAIADGVGGATSGEVASRAVIEEISRLDRRAADGALADRLRAAVLAANAALEDLVGEHPELAGMASTLTAVALRDRGYVVANVGDSRTYLLRDGALTQLTRDESLVQAMIEGGVIDRAQARAHPQRSVVLQALDGRPDLTVTIGSAAARAGDRLMLCSDGLSDMVADEVIQAALASPSRERAAQRLVDVALASGGHDNVTVIIADVVADDPA